MTDGTDESQDDKPLEGATTWKVRYSEHAVDRMEEWELDVDEVEEIIRGGETIEEYDDGSRLVLGRAGVRPLHVVVMDSEAESVRIVVTVYEPDPTRWEADFRRRRAR